MAVFKLSSATRKAAAESTGSTGSAAEAVAREYWLQANSAGWMTKAFLGLVALLFPDLQLFNLSDDIAVGTAIPLALFVKTIALGSFYIVFYLLLAWAVFYRKEL